MSKTSSYYAAGPERGEKVRQLFDHIASRYDLINDIQSFGLHRHWKRELVRMAKVQHGERTLDLCTGTGDLAIRLKSEGADVIGSDFSAGMLAQAKKRAPGLEWVEADALHLPFATATFDLVTIGYGLRNLPDFQAGIREMGRVLKPGGRLLILEFGKPSNKLWRKIYFTYLQLFIPLLGLSLCGNRKAYAYILESLNHYPEQHEMEKLLMEQNFADVQTRNFMGGVMAIQTGRKR
jgi:demethylmenaquinone methyltransferase/2-methoxy-6-polyprenyl-1,4-benzoquinol methylase